jgi:putative ABC transport system permease protein
LRTAAFLAARELRRRWGRAALAAAVVAGAVALSVGLELLGRARERAVEVQLDAAGSALRVLPAGVSAADAAALRLGDAALPGDAEARVRAALGGGLRALEPRALLRDPGTGVGVIATAAPPRGRREPAPGRVLLGADLAVRWRKGAGDVVQVLGRSLAVGGLAPSSADATDYAVHVLAADVGAPAANELRVFLEPGVPPHEAERALRAALPGASVVRTDRGEVADGGLQGSIAAHRRAVQLVTALVAALALLVATHLDASERRRELALLAAIGAPRAGLAAVVALRAVACAAAGAVLGVALAVGLAASQPEFLAAAVPAIAISAVLLAASVAVVAAAPVAVAAASADTVAELQES